MRLLAPLALGLLPVLGWTQSPANPAGNEDPALQSLIQAALDHNPDLARAQAAVEAEGERIPQARALADPILSLGLQNDGFKGLQVGKMETSYYQVMLTQPLTWPGKRGLRGEVAGLGQAASRAALARTRLSLIADVKRAFAGLLLVRGQLELLDQQTLFWQKACEITKVRYEVGQGSQADLLRAQLEQNRLRQTRIALVAEERSQEATLNRLRGTAGAAIPSSARLQDWIMPQIPANTWINRADQESPELQAAAITLRQAERSLDLARKDRYPDFAITAGLMPRGSLDPMWQVGFSVSLPIWSKQKQHRAVAEQTLRRQATNFERENLRNLLAQRIQERSAQQEATLESLKLYREGLLVQSESSFQASLAQYEAGRAPFLSVLESLNGWTADRSGYLQVLAQAQALQIAQEEFNLAGTPPIAAQGLSSSAMGMGGSPSGSGPSIASKPGASAPSSSGSAAAMTAM